MSGYTIETKKDNTHFQWGFSLNKTIDVLLVSFNK